METGSLSYAPKLAVMNLPNPDAPPESVLDAQHDIAHPLVIDDYYIHGKQVNF